MDLSLKAVFDPAHDVLHYEHRPLDAIFAPHNVAVIGATETPGSVGRTVLWNLISNPFGGTVFPVNPHRPSVLGIKAYPDIATVPEPVDLAVVVTPARTVPGVIGECAKAGVQGTIVISAGFKEIGPEGAELERQILEQAQQARMRIVGPNCLGVMNTMTGLNATFAGAMARPGTVGFVSQSGALCSAVLDWSLQENVGFSAFVSVGSMLDVDWGDLIDYLGDDPRTQSIVMYMETIGDARSFLSAAREVAQTKPIIVIKPGRTEGAARAAASHTGSLTGSDEVLEAAFRRCGVLRVNRISDLFHMADVLSKQPRPKGPRLTILTNAGGPGVLATDALITGGAELAEPSEPTMRELNELLPPQWSHNNPVDVLGDASPERYAKALEIAAQDENSDGLLVVLTPQAMTDPTRTAEVLAPYAQATGKPLLASWMGGHDVEAGTAILNRANVPVFGYPDTAARMFSYMWRYAYNLKSLYETPAMPEETEEGAPDRRRAEEIINSVRSAGRTLLAEFESKQVLQAYGIPTVDTRIARSEGQAVAEAREIGFPVVLKVYSETISHKTEVGGVQLNLADEDEVRRAYRAIQHAVTGKLGAQPGGKDFLGVAVEPMVNPGGGYELIVGASIDSQFGPVVLFGAGGQLVEVFRDRSLALPPLNTTLARRMMEQTRIYGALKGVRGRKPVDLAALDRLLVRFSQLVVEQRWIKELDINPLMVSPEGLIALDARVLLHGMDVTREQLPRLAIRPYPRRYVQSWKAADGSEVLIRPIRPEDEPLLVKFHQGLSDRSVYLRYLHPMMLSQRVTHERLARMCFINYEREMALVAEQSDGKGGRQVLGVARMDRLHDTDEGQVSVIVTDHFQGKGLGGELMKRLVQIARDEKMTRLFAVFTADNQGVKQIMQAQGFRIGEDKVQGRLRAQIDL
jgi:acetyltransferase